MEDRLAQLHLITRTAFLTVHLKHLLTTFSMMFSPQMHAQAIAHRIRG
jgi:hypothetical protein